MGGGRRTEEPQRRAYAAHVARLKGTGREEVSVESGQGALHCGCKVQRLGGKRAGG